MLERLRVLTRHIRPINALQELIYGLVMSLATISVVSLAVGLDESTRATLAMAALGVNFT
jgi:thiosulfate reductase cytochrome b subunit